MKDTNFPCPHLSCCRGKEKQKEKTFGKKNWSSKTTQKGFICKNHIISFLQRVKRVVFFHSFDKGFGGGNPAE